MLESQLGRAPTPDEVEGLFKDMDLNTDGKVSLPSANANPNLNLNLTVTLMIAKVSFEEYVRFVVGPSWRAEGRAQDAN